MKQVDSRKTQIFFIDKNSVFLLLLFSYLCFRVSSLGSMSVIAISYGENGPVFCGLKSDGSHLPTCYGSNPAILHVTPNHSPFLGLAAGSGFVCGLEMDSNLPFCCGSTLYVPMVASLHVGKGSEYLEISAGDNHLCGLRKPLMGKLRNTSLVDCWGYNMTKSYVFDGQIQSISAVSEFNCGLFAQSRSVFCWGDQTSSNVIGLVPTELRFCKIAAGRFHVCGILEGALSRVMCWGTSLDVVEQISVSSVLFSDQLNVDFPPEDEMLSVVGGKFHSCGIRSYDRQVICWGYSVDRSTPPPKIHHFGYEYKCNKPERNEKSKIRMKRRLAEKSRSAAN